MSRGAYILGASSSADIDRRLVGYGADQFSAQPRDSVELMHNGDDAAITIEKPTTAVPMEDREILPMQRCKRSIPILGKSRGRKLARVQEKVVHTLVKPVLAYEARREPDDLGGHSGEILANGAHRAHSCASTTHRMVRK
jgi:hypothetical protein